METEFAVSLGSQRWTLPADGHTITIGRGSNADIRLPSDDQISRIHARLNRTGTTWTLVDESRNGTALNGRRLAAPTPLTDDDRIQIGRSVLTFHEPTATPHPDPSHAPAPPQPRPHAAPTPPPAAAPSSADAAARSRAERPARSLADAAGAASAAGLAAGASSAPPPPPTPSPPPAPGTASAGGLAAGTASPTPTPPPPPAPTHGNASPTRTPLPSPASDPGAGLAAGPPAPPHPAPPAHAGPVGTPAPPGPADAPGNNRFRETAEPAPPSDAGSTPPTANPPFWGDPAPAPDSPSAGIPDSARDEWIGGAPAGPPDGTHDEWIGGAAAGTPDGVRDEPIGGTQAGWADGDDAGPAGAWAAYPSADNPEPARSPWSETKRPALTQPEGEQVNWSESAGWPDSAFEGQQSPPPPTPTARQTEQVRRTPAETDDAAAGQVRLVRVLLVAAAVLGLGLVINLVATFFADGAGGTLRWLVPPAIALIAAMVVALLDAIASEERPSGGRLDVPVLVAIGAVLLGVGVGGFALTAGVEYAAGYLTGKESGEDRLIKPVATTGAGVTVTVENVTYTSHFTRVEVAVSNGSDQPLSLPLEGNATFTGADGNSLQADGFRSHWPDSIAAGGVEHGTITFQGHLPEGLAAATLTLKPGNPAITVPGLALSN